MGSKLLWSRIFCTYDFAKFLRISVQCRFIHSIEKKIRLHIFIGPIVCNEGKMRYIKAALSNSKSIKTSPWCVLYPKLGFPVVGNTAYYAVRMNIKRNFSFNVFHGLSINFRLTHFPGTEFTSILIILLNIFLMIKH